MFCHASAIHPTADAGQARYGLSGAIPVMQDARSRKRSCIFFSFPFLCYNEGGIGVDLMDTWKEMEDCRICPRDCGVNRNKGELGYCKVPGEVILARADLHHWEEPCISGESGSGTVFFSGCNMGCVYCQNHEIALGVYGKKVSVKRLSEIFLELQKKGAHNINLVTPSHYAPQIRDAILASRSLGMDLPIVYNTSGYEKVETLKMLEGLIDIYLPDFKYYDRDLAFRYSKVKDYKEVALEALKEMVRQTGEPVFDEEGILLKGTIIRHLSLPGSLHDSKDILMLLKDTFKSGVYFSIMNQYTPLDVSRKYPELQRKLTEEEYQELISFAQLLGI